MQPLSIAARLTDPVAATTIINALVSAGADLSAVCGNEMTPLHWAAFKNNPAATVALLAAGAALVAQDSSGYTPLELARCMIPFAKKDGYECLKVLIQAEHQAGTDPAAVFAMLKYNKHTVVHPDAIAPFVDSFGFEHVQWDVVPSPNPCDVPAFMRILARAPHADAREIICRLPPATAQRVRTTLASLLCLNRVHALPSSIASAISRLALIDV